MFKRNEHKILFKYLLKLLIIDSSLSLKAQGKAVSSFVGQGIGWDFFVVSVVLCGFFLITDVWLM